MIRAAALAAVICAAAAQAAPIETQSGCGGNAYSSAQVTEGRHARKGPLVALPDTLCADLDGPRPSVNIDIYGVPGVSGQPSTSGSGDAMAPYERSPRRRARQPGDR